MENVDIIIVDKNFEVQNLQGLIIRNEENANTIKIQFPKTYEGEDLTGKMFILKCTNANGVYFETLLGKAIKETYIELTWTVTAEFTTVSGTLKVAIFAESANYSLGTKMSKVIVEESPQITIPIDDLTVLESYMTEIRIAADTAESARAESVAIKQDFEQKIVDNLASTDPQKILSANQGRVLDGRINNIVGYAGTSTVEVVDARNSPERGVVYPTLKARLDAVDGDIVKSTYSASADTTAPVISLPSTAVKGKLEGSVKGNTLYQVITGGENQPTGTTKSFIALNAVRYFLLPSKTIIAGTGISVDVTNSTGANANIMAVQLTTPYDSWTADQINAMIDGYWEGLQGTREVGVRAIGKNLFDGQLELGVRLSTTGAKSANLNYMRSVDKYRVKPSTTYRIDEAGTYTFDIQQWDNKGNFISQTNVGVTSFSTLNYTAYVTFNTNASGQNDLGRLIMLNEGSVALPYETYQETELFAPVKLNRLPNGVADEFTLDGKYIQRTSEKTSQSGVVNYADMATGGSFIAQLADGTIQTGVKGATLTATATKIIYQLATPIETQYPSANLIAEPSGSIYVGSKIKLSKAYSTNIAVTSKIKTLESVYRIKGENRIKIDNSLVTVAGDGLSLTILNASAGEIYEVIYGPYGTLLPTLSYSYPNDLAAQSAGNTKAISQIGKNFADFMSYQNAVNVQVDFRLIAGGH